MKVSYRLAAVLCDQSSNLCLSPCHYHKAEILQSILHPGSGGRDKTAASMVLSSDPCTSLASSLWYLKGTAYVPQGKFA